MGIVEDIKQLEELRARGTLSQDEFDAAKAKLLQQRKPAPQSGPGNKGAILGIGVIVVVIAAVTAVPTIIGILAAIVIPNFVAMQYRANRAEVPSNVDGIQTAEMAYDAAFDQYIAVDQPTPRDPSSLNREQAAWTTGTAFDTLGWSPSGPVRGTYWVEVKPTDFTVHGLIDVDGDGEFAHYTATKSINATMVTSSDVY